MYKRYEVLDMVCVCVCDFMMLWQLINICYSFIFRSWFTSDPIFDFVIVIVACMKYPLKIEGIS